MHDASANYFDDVNRLGIHLYDTLICQASRAHEDDWPCIKSIIVTRLFLDD